MRKQLDRILVIDIEATCWEGNPPEGEVSDVIEIGYCVLNTESLSIIDGGTILVRPERSEVSVFCTDLTTLKQEQVDGGVTFAEACERLRRELQSKGLTWASFGDYDRKQIQLQCETTGVPYPFGKTHVNVKNLFALTVGLHREVGMAAALDILGENLEGTHHRGGDDARNIAKILSRLLAAGRSALPAPRGRDRDASYEFGMEAETLA